MAEQQGADAGGDWWSQLVRNIGLGGGDDGANPPAASARVPAAEASASQSAAASALAVDPGDARPSAGGFDMEYDGDEGDDRCGPLPMSSAVRTPSKPMLNVAGMHRSGSQEGGPLSSRSLFSSLASLFTPRTARHEIGRAPLARVIQALKEDRPDDEIADAGRRLLELCPKYDKVARATSHGALDAIAFALRVHGAKPHVVVWLLPPLINLSSGDDDAGFHRAAVLVNHGVLEMLDAVLRANVKHATDVSKGVATAPQDVEMRAQVVERCVWALQHLCRREFNLGEATIDAVPSERRLSACREWRRRIAAAGAVQVVCDVMTAWPARPKVQLHGCNLLGTYVSGRYTTHAMTPASEAYDPPPDMCRCVDLVAAALHYAVNNFGADSPVLGAAIHACADTTLTPGLAAHAVAGKSIVEDLVTTMELNQTSALLQEGCCWAMHNLCLCANRDLREMVASSALPKLAVRALKGQGCTGNLAAMREKACRAMNVLVKPMPLPGYAADDRDETLTQNIKDCLSREDVFRATVVALKAHKKLVSMVVHTCDLLASLCYGNDPYDELKKKAYAHGVIPAIVNVLRKNLKVPEVQDAGRRALIVICYTQELQWAALQAGADPDWSPRGPKQTEGQDSRRPGQPVVQVL